MGYIKRLGEKKYLVMYDVPPTANRPRQQKTKTLIGVTKPEAEARLVKLKETAWNGDHVANTDMSMNELFDAFMEAKQRRLEAATLCRYDSFLRNYLRPQFGYLKVKALKRAHIVAAIPVWEGRDSKPGGRTIHHVYDLLRATLNWAISMEIVQNNVAARFASSDLPKASNPEPNALDENEVHLLLAEAKNPTVRGQKRGTLSSQPWFYPAVMFSVYTGARRGEVLALQWKDIDFEVGAVTIRRSLTDVKQQREFKKRKNDRSLTLTLSKSVLAVLREHREAQNSERSALGAAYKEQDLVFAHADGEKVIPGRFGAAVLRLVKRAGITSVTLHNLRDTHASLLAKAGIPIEVVSKRLGHSGIAITAQRYLSVYSSRDAAAAEAFEDLMG